MPRAVRYRVLRKIAHGGMAEIFLALQTGAEGFQKPVVLKRILPAFAADPHFVRMLVDEAHIASSLSHSHLVQVLDLGKANGQFFLVLEFVDGFSLEQVRRRAQKARVKFPLPLALNIVASLCRGLSYVHQRTRDSKPLGIVHRDVSPQNVLLGREGEVKLADFGIAKAVGRREKSATGIIKGKFAYMSPEQSIGAALDARSDLFSVGTLLYILTTGRKPFDAPTDLEVLMQVRRARYEKPSTLVKDFNPEVERFITRALRADRSRRWQTAEQMADRLDAIMVKLGQSSGPAGLKRWLDALGARDGVRPPGDLGEDATDASAGTIELETDDLVRADHHSGPVLQMDEAASAEAVSVEAASVEVASVEAASVEAASVEAASVAMLPSLSRAVNAQDPPLSPSRVAYASVSVRRAPELVAVPNPVPERKPTPAPPPPPAMGLGDGDTTAEHDAPTRPAPAAHLIQDEPEFADPDFDDEDNLSIEIPIFEEEPLTRHEPAGGPAATSARDTKTASGDATEASDLDDAASLSTLWSSAAVSEATVVDGTAAMAAAAMASMAVGTAPVSVAPVGVAPVSVAPVSVAPVGVAPVSVAPVASAEPPVGVRPATAVASPAARSGSAADDLSATASATPAARETAPVASPSLVRDVPSADAAPASIPLSVLDKPGAANFRRAARRPGRWRPWFAATLLLLAIAIAGGTFARSYVSRWLPAPWLARVDRVAQPVDAWIERQQARFERLRAPPADAPAAGSGAPAP